MRIKSINAGNSSPKRLPVTSILYIIVFTINKKNFNNSNHRLIIPALVKTDNVIIIYTIFQTTGDAIADMLLVQVILSRKKVSFLN